jgi:predicted HAD superfamily Cof-like phosphohydrolase
MQELINSVKEFHKTFDLPVELSPTLGDSKEAMRLAQLRYELGKEELKEFYEAAVKKDLVGVFDALVDQLYILLGTAHCYGMADALVEGFIEVHRSNMTKLGADGKPILREDGKILKPESYEKPDLDSVLRKIYTD